MAGSGAPAPQRGNPKPHLELLAEGADAEKKNSQSASICGQKPFPFHLLIAFCLHLPA
jgi:hypothetical protein